jgi:hypothetical protein
MMEADGQGQPARDPADPGGGVEGQCRGERTEQQVEDPMRVGRLEEEVAGGIAGVGGVAGLRQIDRLVDVGHRPRAGGGEQGRDGGDFGEPTPPGTAGRRIPPIAFVCHRAHV